MQKAFSICKFSVQLQFYTQMSLENQSLFIGVNELVFMSQLRYHTVTEIKHKPC